MRLAEIRVGESYAVSVNAEQVDVEDAPGRLAFQREYLLEKARRSRFSGELFIRDGHNVFGYRARVVGFEVTESGRRVVRVELAGYQVRHVEPREEDNGDGTRTIWEGRVVDADGNTLLDEEPFEAVISPQQVKLEWTEATVRIGVWNAEREWTLARDGLSRIFPTDQQAS